MARPQRTRLFVEELETRITPVVWPIGLDPNTNQPYPNDHQMLSGYGDGSLISFARFHEGIDLYVNGQGGQFVRAARAGTLVRDNPNYGGWTHPNPSDFAGRSS